MEPSRELAAKKLKNMSTKGKPITNNRIAIKILGKTIKIDVKKGTPEYDRVVKHEAQHVKDLQSGRAAFGDDYVRWEGKTYARKSGMIKYNGKWKEEGDKSFPWEKVAINAEKN